MVSIFSLPDTIEQYAYRKMLAQPNFEFSDEAEQNRLIDAIHQEAISGFLSRWYFNVINYFFPIRSRVVAAVDSALQNLGRHCNRIGPNPYNRGIEYRIDQNFKSETNKNVTSLVSSAFFIPYLQRNFGLSQEDYDRLVQCELDLIKTRLPPGQPKPSNKILKEQAAKDLFKRLDQLSKSTKPEQIGDLCLVKKGLKPRHVERNFGLTREDYDLLVHCEMRLIKAKISLLPAEQQKVHNKNLKEKAAARVLNRLVELSKTTDPELIGDICLAERGLKPRFTLFRQLTIDGGNAYELLQTKYPLSGREILSLLWFTMEKFKLPLGNALLASLGQWLSTLDVNQLNSLKVNLIKLEKIFGPLWDSKRKVEVLLSPGPHERLIFALVRDMNKEFPNLDQFGRQIFRVIIPEQVHGQLFGISHQYVRRNFISLCREPGVMSAKMQRRMDQRFKGDLGKIQNGHFQPFYERDHNRFDGRIIIGNKPFRCASDPSVQPPLDEIENRDAMIAALNDLCGEDQELFFIAEIAAAQEFEIEIACWFNDALQENDLKSEDYTPKLRFLSKAITKIPQGLEVDFDMEFELYQVCQGHPLLEKVRTKVHLELTRGEGGTWQRKWTWKDPSPPVEEAVAARLAELV